MKNRRIPNFIMLALMLAFLGIWSLPNVASAVPVPKQIPTGPKTLGFNTAEADPVPDYYTTANWANSPPIAKFVDTLPGLNSANNLGQMLPVAEADTTTYPGSDYYVIGLVQYTKKMHSDLQPTTLRGYVQLNDDGLNGKNYTAKLGGGDPTLAAHYLGPVIVAKRDRPVRLKFVNMLPAGSNGEGNLFIPVDKSVMGAGTGPADANGPCDNVPLNNACSSYTENRANIHLHGGRTPWISDGTPHQWIIPADQYASTPFKQGVSLQNVPDMPAPGPGETTYYFTNQQSARLMFYHDHAFGITRLNVYAGEAAGYVITDPHEQDLIDRGLLPGTKTNGQTVMGGQIPLIIQDKTFVDATLTDKYIYNPATGLFDTLIQVPKVRETDPLWNWGGGALDGNGVRTPIHGDLWLPHVYMPAQNSLAGSGGVNPFGRWMYGPWFYPPTVVEVGPKANPYYDERCSSANPFELAECTTPGQPLQIPGTPNVSMGMEAFQDSVVVNGTAFPTLTVDPKAYRFRILNAASDRFQNLSFYVADGTAGNVSLDGRLPTGATATLTTDGNGFQAYKHNRTEVKMALASPALAAANNWPADWPVDGREEMVPDPGFCAPGGVNCPNLGPSFMQIGTEGGFLPNPVMINPQPVTYITDPTAFWVGVVDKTGLALGPAERADVIVDFNAYRGKTLILYNDAPAAWPARVPGYDYYTKAPDMRDSGGYGTGGTFNQETGAWENGTGPLPGKAPNTRTVMQVIVRDVPPTPFSGALLAAEFKAGAPVVNTATYQNPAPTKTLFERSQEPIIVGQAAYADAYPNSYFPTNFPWEGINQMNDHFLDFVTLKGDQVHAITEPKGIHDEMGASFDPIYGRMSGNLAMQIPNPTTLTANLILYGFSDVPTENVNNSDQYEVTVLPGADGKPGTLADGTQIWKISHNGVDTHPIHFHIFDVQLINRVGWDGQIALPNQNELGWKDTIKISPLMDTIVAVRPRAPALPFGIPNSFRPLNPALPIDTTMGFNSIDPVTGQAYVAPSPYAGGVTNTIHNFGWEYVWHCHILSHEEMDMMRPIVLNYVAELPPAFTAYKAANAITWDDPTPFPVVSPAIASVPADPETYRATTASSEIGYNVYRSELDGTTFTPVNGKIVPFNEKMIPANSTSFPDTNASTNGRSYIVEAFNAKGSTFAIAGASNFTITATLAATGGSSFTTGTLIPLVVTPVNAPPMMTVKEVIFYDGPNVIATVAGPGLSTDWVTDLAINPNAVLGLHTLSARIKYYLGNDVVTAPITVNITGALVADFTASTGVNAPSLTFAKCDPINFASTTTGTVGATAAPNFNPGTAYSWSINGKFYNNATVSNVILPVGVAGATYPVTLGVVNVADITGVTVATDQITKNITITGANTPPTISTTGGPYNVAAPGQTLTLAGVGADADGCDVLMYSWDLDGKNGYEFNGTTNPAAISFNALKSVLGFGVHRITLKVTDPSGASVTATTLLTVGSVKNDFNSDGKPDLILRNSGTGGNGNNAVWYMNNNVKTGEANITAVADVNYKLAGSGDFNGDGKPDLLWRNAVTGINVIWYMNGNIKTGDVRIADAPAATWQIVGVSDFNGDGNPDILWRNGGIGGSGSNIIWYMRGINKIGEATIPTVADLNYEIVGTGDFNQDGKTDIVWRRNSTGTNVVWYMNGNIKIGESFLPPLAVSSYKIAGIADFNADGYPDIIWRNNGAGGNGNNAVWYMKGNIKIGDANLPAIPTLSYEIVNR